VVFVAGFHKYKPGNPDHLTFAQAEAHLLFEKSGWNTSCYTVSNEKEYLSIIGALTEDTLIYYTGHGEGRGNCHPLLCPSDSPSFDPLNARDVNPRIKLSFVLDCCNCYATVHLEKKHVGEWNHHHNMSYLNPSREYTFCLRYGNSGLIYGFSTIFATCFVRANVEWQCISFASFSRIFEILLYKAYRAGNLLDDPSQRTILFLNDKLVPDRIQRKDIPQPLPVTACFLSVSEEYAGELNNKVKIVQVQTAPNFSLKTGEINIPSVDIIDDQEWNSD